MTCIEEPKIAVLIPCYNEAVTIEKVIADFHRELPSADIYVYDNNSTDDSFQKSLNSAAIVRKEYRQGKGHVVRSMFRDVDADIYLMVDGDDTYPAEACHELISAIKNQEADMVVGDRLSNGSYVNENGRVFHNFGNSFVKKTINFLFRSKLKDIMSGYRCFNAKFVKTIPILSPRFEVETEMTLHALDKRFVIKEIPIIYRDRPANSVSKLNTFSDGFRVISKIFMLFKDYRPFYFFTIVSLFLLLCASLTAAPVFADYMLYRYVYHVPLAILSTGIVLMSGLAFISGVILDSVVKYYRYQYELYLNEYIRTGNK